MRYTVSEKDAQSIVAVVGLISGDSKTEVIYTPEKKMLTITAYGGVRQAQIKVQVKSDAEEGERVVFETKTFVALLNAVLSLKKDINLEVAPAIAYIEVEGKARLAIVPIAEDAIQGITLTKSSLLLQMQINAAKALRAFKIGGNMAQDSDTSTGMNNVLMTIGEGKAYISSINGLSGANSACPITVNPVKEEVVEENLKKYKEEKGLDELMLPIPKQVSSDIASLLAISETALIAASDKAIHLMPQGNVLYSAVLGANAFTRGRGIIEQMIATPKSAEVTVDAQNLRESVSLLKKTMDLASNKKTAMIMTLVTGEVRLESALNAESCVRLSTVEGECAEISKGVDPALLLEAISALSGNLTISYPEAERAPLVITSGTVSAPNTDDAIIISPIAIESDEEDEAEESEVFEETADASAVDETADADESAE